MQDKEKIELQQEIILPLRKRAEINSSKLGRAYNTKEIARIITKRKDNPYQAAEHIVAYIDGADDVQGYNAEV